MVGAEPAATRAPDARRRGEERKRERGEKRKRDMIGVKIKGSGRERGEEVKKFEVGEERQGEKKRQNIMNIFACRPLKNPHTKREAIQLIVLLEHYYINVFSI